jgi:hypothetical protein
MVQDATLAAIAKWLFNFIRLNLRCGYTLNEIEKNLFLEIKSGEMQKFLKSFYELDKELEHERR